MHGPDVPDPAQVLYLRIKGQFDAINWAAIDADVAGLIDQVRIQLEQGNWKPAGERAGAALVHPFKEGIFAGFVAAVAKEDLGTETPGVGCGARQPQPHLRGSAWREFFRGTIEGTGIDLPEMEPLTPARRKRGKKAAASWRPPSKSLGQT